MHYSFKIKRFYIFWLFILSWFIVKIETKNCLSSEFLNRKCLNNSTCVNTGNEARCACNLPYNGTNCDLCLCFSNNQTCSIYGESICSTLDTSLYNSTFNSWFYLAVFSPFLCCSFILLIYLLSAYFYVSFRLCCFTFNLACCHTDQNVLPTRPTETQNNINLNIFTINTTNRQNEQFIIEQDSFTQFTGLRDSLIIHREINEKNLKRKKETIISKLSSESSRDENNNDDESPICIICLTDLNNETVKSISCGHTFHQNCIDNWFQENLNNPSCPFRCKIEETQKN